MESLVDMLTLKIFKYTKQWFSVQFFFSSDGPSKECSRVWGYSWKQQRNTHLIKTGLQQGTTYTQYMLYSSELTLCCPVQCLIKKFKIIQLLYNYLHNLIIEQFYHSPTPKEILYLLAVISLFSSLQLWKPTMYFFIGMEVYSRHFILLESFNI